MKKSALLFCCVWLVQSFSAQAQNVRKYSNEFLSIGVGARGLAMSSSVTSSVDDVTATYWNPAGLTQIRNNFQLSVMHAEYFAGIAKLDYGAVAIPLKDQKRVIGISMIRFAVDDIPNTLNLFEDDGSINYDNIKSFSVGDYAFNLSYAQKTAIPGLSFGGNFKLIYRKAGSFANAWGFGLDAGAQYQVKRFRVGLMARDITGTFNAWNYSFTDDEKEVLAATGNEIPSSSLEITLPRVILGLGYEFAIKNKFFILPEFNFDMTTDGKRNVLLKTNSVSIDPRFGLELNYNRIVYLRGGVGNIQKSTDDLGKAITTFQPTIGGGIRIKSVAIDYAFTDIGNTSEALYSHVFSINLGINKRKK
jgi:hypothetical protein